MPTQFPLIAVIVIGLGLAFALGTLAHRLRLSPLVGYLAAGIALGPFTPGFVANQQLMLQLAQVGVILLMFGVGLRFSLKDLLSVRGIAVPGALLQVAASTALGMSVAWLIGWPAGTGLVFGFALSIASTVVMLRALQERHLTETGRGHIAIGWLVVQDLLTLLVLVLLPLLAPMLNGVNPATDLGAFSQALAITLAKLLAFVALMLVVGRTVVPAILHYIAHTGSRELFRLAVLSLALGVAFAAAELFGVSLAIGAFFAGMILSESPLSQRAAEESLPLRDAFAVLFFVSVGMLFNPLVVVRDPLALALTLLVVMVGGAGATLLIMRAFGYPLASALLVGAGLAQIGEFSYVLADFGIGLHMLPERARDLILGTSIISICVNPLLLSVAEKMRRRLEPEKEKRETRAAADEELEPTRLSGHAIIVGYGRVGSLLGADLRKRAVPFLVIETAQDIVERLRAEGTEVIPGNAATEGVLKAANLPGARLLFVAIPEAFEAGQIVAQARTANSRIEIVARAHFDAEVDHLRKYGANAVIMGEREIARAMLEYVGVAQPEVHRSADSA